MHPQYPIGNEIARLVVTTFGLSLAIGVAIGGVVMTVAGIFGS
jgi:hypothetical protein